MMEAFFDLMNPQPNSPPLCCIFIPFASPFEL